MNGGYHLAHPAQLSVGPGMNAPGRSGPRVRIVVPSFQQGRFLRPCLESLLHQRYHGLEVVVVDNLSFDETESVLRDFGPRLTRVIREADNGQTHALLKGFGEGDAEILGWLNVDDMLMPDAVQRVVRAFSETGADVVSGHCSALDGRGQFQGYMASRVRPRPGLALHLADVIPQPACFFSRAAY